MHEKSPGKFQKPNLPVAKFTCFGHNCKRTLKRPEGWFHAS